MAASGLGGCDILIIYSLDAEEWCQYLQNLFLSSRQVRNQKTLTYRLGPKTCFSAEDLSFFLHTRCIIVLLSAELVQCFCQPTLLPLLQRAFYPPHRVVRLLCGVQDSEEFLDFFPDWAHWKELTCDDEPETYVAAVKKAISEDSGCDSVTDTETEDEKVLPYSKQQCLPLETSPGNLMVVQPDRIRCGAETTVYVIVRCKLDERVTTEAEFTPEDSPSIRVEAKLENEYTVSVKAPNLSSGNVSLKIYSGDLVACETVISYYTDMEEIGNLLSNAANPVEFMCQAFKIVPYNTETLDKLLTESLKNNIPASGLHLFGINQLEEEDMMTNQREEELPTLLHFAAKYGLKNLTALLLTCPGALQAYSVANKHGHYPNTIAEKHGFRDLRQFIDEYVETVDMLKSHIKEELMQGEESDSVYESMAHLSTDLLMKCSLNPGCDEELYESMAAFVPAATEDLYVEMLQASTSNPMAGDSYSRTTKDSMIRKFLEGNSMGMASMERDAHHLGQEEDVYHTVDDDEAFSVDLASRPPVPVPRPEASASSTHQVSDNEPYISKVFAEKSQERPGNLYVSSESIRKEPPVRPWRDRPQSSIYDPFAGMKTPGQRQLITLQEQVKLGIVNVDEAVLHFKEWQLNQKKRSESFRFQQENLKRLRESITRRQREKQKSGKQTDLEITVPIRHSQHLPGKVEIGVYESGPRKSVFPPRTELRRGDWKTDSTSSTASSTSNRSSTRSLLSVSSGMDGICRALREACLALALPEATCVLQEVMGIPSFLALPAARSDWADCMPCHPLGHMLLWTALLFLAPVPGTRGKCSTHILSPQQLPPRSAPSTLSGDALSECSSNPGLKQSQGRIIAPSRCLVPFFFLLLFLPGKRGMGSTMHRYFSPSGSVNHETSYIVSQKRNVLSFNCLPLSKLNHEPRQFLFQPHAKSHDLLRPSHCVDKSSTFHTSEGFRACSPGQ